MKKTGMILWIAVFFTLPCISQERGNLIFSDDFDTQLTFAENWVPGKGWANRLKSEGGAARFPDGGILYMRRDTPANFYAEMDLAFGLSDGKFRAGFEVDGKYYTISATGVIFGWRGEAIDGFETGKPVKLTLIRQCSRKNACYVFQVNGKEVKREVAPLPKGLQPDAGTGTDAPISENPEVKLKPLGIFVYAKSTVVDNFRLFALKDGAVSNNVIINSGFEYEQDGFPPYICREGSFGYGKYQSVSYEEYLATWSLDTREKHSGKQSHSIIQAFINAKVPVKRIKWDHNY